MLTNARFQLLKVFPQALMQLLSDRVALVEKGFGAIHARIARFWLARDLLLPNLSKVRCDVAKLFRQGSVELDPNGLALGTDLLNDLPILGLRA
jgi:hypothetical protein